MCIDRFEDWTRKVRSWPARARHPDASRSPPGGDCRKIRLGISLRGAAGQPVGRLFFAGEHCALDTQGFMEGGVESDETAAAQVLASLGIAAAKAA